MARANINYLKRLTLVYLTGYLAVGGIGLLFVPDVALALLLSNGEYGDIMPRLVGMFMLVLSGLIGSFVRHDDYSYYSTTIYARSFIVVTMTVLYFRTDDPLFVVLDAIVLLGLLPAIYLHFIVDAARPSSNGPSV